MGLRMMVLDMKFEDAESPQVLLYGIASDGRRLCCTVNDFMPYFWFPAPTLPTQEEVTDKLGLLSDILNQNLSSQKKKSFSRPAVAAISLAYRTPLMYFRQGSPFPYLKIELCAGKSLPLAAKTLKSLVESHKLDEYGLVWRDTTCYEEIIKFGMRFCCDTNIAGGAWVEIEEEHVVAVKDCDIRCEQLQASWRNIKGLTRDATSYVDTIRKNDGVTSPSASSVSGDCCLIPSMRILGLHVLYTWEDLLPGASEAGDSRKLECAGVCDLEGLGTVSYGRSAVSSKDPVILIGNIFKQPRQQKKLVFIYAKGFRLESEPSVEVRMYGTEAEMLLAWERFINSELDPDVICLYQLKDSLRYLTGRFKALKLGTLDISRFKGRPTQVKSVVTYGKHWVKQQARMSSTSNQEVFRASVEGRLVIDMLRVVLVAYSLSTFTLGECAQVLLHKTKEVLSLAAISSLWKNGEGGLRRLMHYSLQEAEVTLELMERLQTIPESIEMARVTGLSISDVLYKAQMIRVQSLLLRVASKEGWLLGGQALGGQLSESPFLLHPREHNTAGFYENPVCILDFSSLYPSVFMAYNLCYTTFVHPEDVSLIPADDVFVSPTGAHFVKENVRHGILPRICGALIKARKLARDRIASKDTSVEEKAVLDGRQRALKICANALYGFTGAGASPQQALPLADSCLSIGASLCKRAINLVESTFDTAKVVYAQTDSVFVKLERTSTDQAVAIAKDMADRLSESFAPPIALKFERVLCPFLLLQVNRYAGKQFLSDRTDESNGTLFVRGLESERRDVPYFVRRVCSTILDSIIIKRDVPSAISECKSLIRELVSGRVSMFELLMTGGLWRVDDADIARLAAGSNKSPRKVTAEEGRGPHVALAVRLKRKNPNRQFHIGERIPYVLVSSGSKLQDEMAEDPVTALAEDLPINVHVYLENKLRKPLESILEHVVSAGQLKDIFSGSHTVPSSSSVSSSGTRNSQASVSSFFKRKASCLVCRNPLADEDGVLCETCWQEGAERNTTALLIAQRTEVERKFAAHAECLRCHSGGLTGCILCTSTDCPLFYHRYECCRRLEHLESLLQKFRT